MNLEKEVNQYRTLNKTTDELVDRLGHLFEELFGDNPLHREICDEGGDRKVQPNGVVYELNTQNNVNHNLINSLALLVDSFESSLTLSGVEEVQKVMLKG